MQPTELKSNNNHYTLLRIKRKRTDEPLDALAVVESRTRRKKSRGGGLDVFQFAQTVEDDAWKDEGTRQNIQSQISKLAQNHVNGSGQASPVRETRSPATMRTGDEGNRRYTIKAAEQETEHPARKRPTSPPKIISAKDVPQNDFKMYDAVPADQEALIQSLDLEMEKFLPMLQDYLTCMQLFNKSYSHSPTGCDCLVDDAVSKGGDAPKTGKDAVTTNDYVWDVFYRRPYSLLEWQTMVANVGTVTGLPPLSDSGLSSPDESEEEDEADEDSNAEEYYKNDYPDEESDSNHDDDGSDIFHEHSESDDVARYDDFSDDDHHVRR
ncbi:hypothetical protein J3A83DRAFT_4085080 [Scleroderma citrinum]